MAANYLTAGPSTPRFQEPPDVHHGGVCRRLFGGAVSNRRRWPAPAGAGMRHKKRPAKTCFAGRGLRAASAGVHAQHAGDLNRLPLPDVQLLDRVKSRNPCAKHSRQVPRYRPQALDLIAAMLILDTPLAKVLAVVTKHSITILANPGTRPTDHLRAGEANQLMGSHPDTAATREISKRRFLHRSPGQVVSDTSIVDDSAGANVNAVMREAGTGCDKV